MTETIAEWKPAPRGVPTGQERLEMVLRLLVRATTIEVAIYSHGTAVFRPAGSQLPLDDLIRRYDLPQDGAGGPMGDIWPTAFDDGSALYGWEPVGQDLGGAISVLTAAELDPHKTGSPDFLLTAGLWARRQRSLDAKAPSRSAHWSRP